MTGRRDFLGISATLAAAPIGPAVAADHSDGALLAACARFHAVDAEVNAADAAAGRSEVAVGAAIARWYAALEHLTSLAPHTSAGLASKARAAHAALRSVDDGDGGLQHEEAAALSVLTDLLRLLA